MNLKRLHLKDFRCFDELRIEFGKRLTVIIAENGAGKTAILNAVAIGFGRYLTKLPRISGLTTKETDLCVSQGEQREPFMMLAWEATTQEGGRLVWAAARKQDYTITLLNLNSPYLVTRRRQWWDELDQLFEEHRTKGWSMSDFAGVDLLPHKQRLSHFFSLTRQFFGPLAEDTLQQHAPGLV